MRLIKNVLKDEEIQIYEKVLSNMKEWGVKYDG
jgi:hypothetical protein